MLLKVALCGTHGSGKTYIITELSKRAWEQHVYATNIESPTRYVKSLGFENNKSLDYQTELMSVALRKERQILAERDCLGNAKEYGKQLLLADRCLLDELAYTHEGIRRGQLSATSVGLRLAGANAVPTWVQHLESLYPVLCDFAMKDVSTFWDRIFLKEPHPGYPPTADGDRIADAEYQLHVNDCMLYQYKRAKEAGVPIQKLPLDRDEAIEVIWTLIKDKLELKEE